VARALEGLIAEAIQETPEQRGWEVHLDVLTKAAKNLPPAAGGPGGVGAAGQSLLDLVAALEPVLRQRFGPYGPVSLREITEESVTDICRLSDTLSEPRKYFVTPNAISIAQGTYSRYAWFRAIYAGEAPVGFLMLYDDPDEPEYFLWRFMIAEPYHGRGFGRQAIGLLAEHVKTRPGAKELLVSCGQGEGSPEGFYQRLGFKPNGRRYGYEVGLTLTLNG
jgi:diamine N-acetyltransferase